jgi:hypothetical protein
MFKEYQSKPITRNAYQIKPEDTVVQYGDSNEYKVVVSGKWVTFKAHQEIENGDWIVHLSDSDVYHCTDEVFRERNIVE